MLCKAVYISDPLLYEPRETVCFVMIIKCYMYLESQNCSFNVCAICSFRAFTFYAFYIAFCLLWFVKCFLNDNNKISYIVHFRKFSNIILVVKVIQGKFCLLLNTL